MVAGAHAFATKPKAAFAAAEAKFAKAFVRRSRTMRFSPLAVPGHVEILTTRAAQGIAECEYALELGLEISPPPTPRLDLVRL